MSVFPAAAFLTSANEAQQFVVDQGVEVAVAGRSNAGKSSAINAIVNRRGFARTSKSPGRTQLINFFSLGADRRLVDLPGYGYAKVSVSMRRHWQSLIEQYFQGRESLVATFVVVDSRRLLGDFDQQMIEWCLAVDCPVHVLLTKADKLKKQAARNALIAVEKELDSIATVQLFSATKGQGIDLARRHLDSALATSRS
jgi:GTP-binding protein